MFVFAKDCKEEVQPNGVVRKIKGYSDDLMVVELHWQPGMEGSLHSHPHRQCCYVLEGVFEAEVAGEKKILSSGDCCYIQANQQHGLKALEEGILLDIFTPKREDFIK